MLCDKLKCKFSLYNILNIIISPIRKSIQILCVVKDFILCPSKYKFKHYSVCTIRIEYYSILIVQIENSNNYNEYHFEPNVSKVEGTLFKACL